MEELKEFKDATDRFIVNSIEKGEIVQIYKVTTPLQKYSNWSDDDDDDYDNEDNDDDHSDKAHFDAYEKRLCRTRILLKQKNRYFLHLHKYEQLFLKTSQHMFRIGHVLSDETEIFLNKLCFDNFGYDESYHEIQNPNDELTHMKTANETIVELLESQTKHAIEEMKRPNRFGETMLCVAAQQGSLVCAKLFIHDIFTKNTFTLHTALIVAVIHGHDHITEYILDHLNKNVEERERLLFVNASCKQNKTALHYACEYGNEKMVMLLLENGADPNSISKWGPTPLMCSTNPTIIDMLVEKKADINMVLYNNTTCLYNAVRNKEINVVEKLLTYTETDVSFENEENVTSEIEARRLKAHFKNFKEYDYKLASKMVDLFEKRKRRDIRDILLRVNEDLCYDVISEITSFVV